MHMGLMFAAYVLMFDDAYVLLFVCDIEMLYVLIWYIWFDTADLKTNQQIASKIEFDTNWGQ